MEQQQPIKFLVVCKEVGTSRDLHGMLVALGHSALVVTGGEEAIAHLRTDLSINWVISGIKLGGALDGFGLIEAIRKDNSSAQLPIFMIVDPSLPDTGEKKGDPSFVLLQSLGMTDFLMEPIRQDALRAKIALARGRRQDTKPD